MAPRSPEYRFYCVNDLGIERISSPPPHYSWSIWTPARLPALQAGLPGIRLKLRFHFRWLLSLVYRFPERDCGALLIHDREQVVHYSAFTPRYWRFPFMAAEDLQIGDTWTSPAYRGKGFAFFALCTIVANARRPGRRFWYVVGNLNQPSIHVVEKAGFDLVGEGTWIKPWGIKMLGSYAMSGRRPSGPDEISAGVSVSS